MEGSLLARPAVPRWPSTGVDRERWRGSGCESNDELWICYGERSVLRLKILIYNLFRNIIILSNEIFM